MSIIINKKVLKNDVTILIVEDSLLDYNFTIKFNNYGAILDKYNEVYGLQHLLEHAIFYNAKDLNLDYNAQTSMHYMAVQLHLTDNKELGLYYIKKWLFKNNDFQRIDFSKNLTYEDVRRYIE